MNYYQMLQVDRAASPEVVDAAYKRLAKMYHPDTNRAPDALGMMQAVNEAYQVIGNPSTRAAYDHKLEYEESVSRSKARSSEASSTNYSDPKSQQSDRGIVFDIPIHCEKCGQSDSSLRLAVFPYVVSVVLLTFRRSWGGLYCRKCRNGEMTKAKLITFFFGWWGIPFGFFYAIGNLFTPSEGVIPHAENAAYLRILGAWFHHNGKPIAAAETLNSSLQYHWDGDLAQVFKSLYGSDPQRERRVSNGDFAGAVTGLAAILAALLILMGISGYYSGKNKVTLTSTESSVAVAVTPLPPPKDKISVDGWRNYTNASVGFSSIVPSGHDVQDFVPDGNDAAKGVIFATRGEDGWPTLPTIRVISYPMEAYQPVNEELLYSWATDWLADINVTIVSPAALTTVGGYPAVQFVYENDLTESAPTVRAHGMLVTMSDTMYFIEVTGRIQEDQLATQYFNKLVDTFHALE
jgi:hypothetical protein